MIKLELSVKEVDIIIQSLKELAIHKKHQSEDLMFSPIGRERKREDFGRLLTLAEMLTIMKCSQM